MIGTRRAGEGGRGDVWDIGYTWEDLGTDGSGDSFRRSRHGYLPSRPGARVARSRPRTPCALPTCTHGCRGNQRDITARTRRSSIVGDEPAWDVHTSGDTAAWMQSLAEHSGAVWCSHDGVTANEPPRAERDRALGAEVGPPMTSSPAPGCLRTGHRLASPERSRRSSRSALSAGIRAGAAPLSGGGTVRKAGTSGRRSIRRPEHHASEDSARLRGATRCMMWRRPAPWLARTEPFVRPARRHRVVVRSRVATGRRRAGQNRDELKTVRVGWRDLLRSRRDSEYR